MAWHKYMRASEAIKHFDVTEATLRKWGHIGKVRTEKDSDGVTIFLVQDIRQYAGLRRKRPKAQVAVPASATQQATKEPKVAPRPEIATKQTFWESKIFRITTKKGETIDVVAATPQLACDAVIACLDADIRAFEDTDATCLVATEQPQKVGAVKSDQATYKSNDGEAAEGGTPGSTLVIGSY